MTRDDSDLRLLSLVKAAATDRTDLVLGAFSPSQVEWVVTTGLGPWLARATRDDPHRSVSEHLTAVQSADLTARILCGETLDAATEILDACSAHGPVVGLLKGISACEQEYPEPHLRPMGDIDLLVEPRAVAPLEAVLLELGYERRSRYPPGFYTGHHHTCPFFRAATEDWVEVHVALFPPGSPPGKDRVFAAANVAAELETSSFRGHEVRRLSAELQVPYLAAHWGFELETIGALVPMIDLLLLLGRNRGLDWDKILDWLEGSAAAAHLYLLSSFLDRHGLLHLDPSIITRLRAIQRPLAAPNRRLAFRLLERYVVRGDDFGALMTSRNFDVVWNTLLLRAPAWLNLCRLPWRLIPDRFKPASEGSS